MNYPNDFQTPVNPAGTGVAISRFMAICASVAFLLVVFLCVILVWSARSDKLVPFLISTNNDTGEWTVIGRGKPQIEYSAEQTIQESLIVKYTREWLAKINPDWELVESDMVLTPGNGNGLWIMTAKAGNEIEFKAFITVAKNSAEHPETMGFYVADFNAYRIQ